MPKYKIITIVDITADNAEEALENMLVDDEAELTTKIYCTGNRTCDECKAGMNEGYLAGGKYLCSTECLNKHYTDEEWGKLHAENPDEFYYTAWEEPENEDDVPAPEAIKNLNFIGIHLT